MRFFAIALTASTVFVLGCPRGPGAGPDGGVLLDDAGTPNHDAGRDADAGFAAEDAGSDDAGAAASDAGSSLDAGFFEDAGPPLCADPAQHNGGDGVCVPLGSCSTDFFLTANERCSAWRETEPLPNPNTNARLVVSGNRIYDMCDAVNTVVVNYMSTLVGDDVTPWNAISPPPAQLYCAAALSADGQTILVAGGMDPFTSALDGNIYSAPVLADGTLGTWSAQGALVVERAGASAFTFGGRMFVGGGVSNGGALSSIEVLDVAPDHSVSAGGLVGAYPSQLALHTTVALPSGVVTVTNGGDDWVYVTSDPQLQVWSTYSGVSPFAGVCIATDGQHLIAAGGVRPDPATQSSPPVDAVHVADIAPDLTVSPWRRVGGLSIRRSDGACAIVGDSMIVAGGVSLDDTGARLPLATVLIAKIDTVLRSVEAQ